MNKTDIEALNPCNECSVELRSTCQSLGTCETHDAWRRVERELSLVALAKALEGKSLIFLSKSNSRSVEKGAQDDE